MAQTQAPKLPSSQAHQRTDGERHCPRWLCVLSMCVLVVTLGCSAEQNCVSDTRELVHDFGVVAPGSSNRSVFQLLNDTPETLTVTGVETSCNCSTPVVSPRVVEPGGSFRVELVFDADMRSYDFSGRATCAIQGDSGTELHRSFRFLAKVRAGLEVSTRRATVRTVSGAGPERFDFDVTYYTPDQSSELQVSFDSEWLSLESKRLVKSDANHRLWHIVVSADTNRLELGVHEAEVSLVPTGSKLGIVLPVEVIVKNCPVPLPDRVFHVSGQKEVSEIELIFRECEAPTDVSGFRVSCDVENLSCRVFRDDQGAWRLRCESVPGNETISGNVEVRISDRSSVLIIPAYVKQTRSQTEL